MKSSAMSNRDRAHLHVYGIRNCDSCRRALRWLGSRRVPHTFHDVREEGFDAKLLDSWLASAQGPDLVNRRSATWRRLTDAEKRQVDAMPRALLMEQPTLLKRPVITDGERILGVGFDPNSIEEFI